MSTEPEETSYEIGKPDSTILWRIFVMLWLAVVTVAILILSNDVANCF